MLYLDVLDKIINEIKNSWNIPGVGVGIAIKNRIVFEKYYGIQDIENQNKVDTNTRFCIASISKFFVALTIMHLQEQEKLNIVDRFCVGE